MGISVRIKAGRDVGSSSIEASGSIQHVITDKERALFGLNDNALKQAVKAYFGKAPNDAFLCSPTPWNDLYKTYGWSQVQTVLVVQKAQILEITSNPSIIKTTRLQNTSSKPGTFSARVNDSVTNTIETNWNSTTSLEFSQSLEYSVGIEGLASVGGSTSWSFSQSFGVGGSRSESVSVGSDEGVSVDLAPGESVEAQLAVSSGAMRARVFYKAYLLGKTAINYHPTFKDHHFFALDIGAVMAAGGLDNSLHFTEDIQLGYYSNAEVRLSDAAKHALRALAAGPAAEAA
jgi:hypothetical protein